MTIKIGIICDRYHLDHKLAELLQYLKAKVQVKLYNEQDFLLCYDDLKLREDMFFIKTKGDLALSLVRYIERQTDIPVINSYKGIYLAMHRFLNSLILEKNNINIPPYGLIPNNLEPPLDNYIIKNIIDQKNYFFKPQLERIEGEIHVFDERALIETQGKEKIFKHFYYQEYIKSDWEYKVYGVGDELFFFKQIPILFDSNKMKSRKKIPEIEQLREHAIKAMNVLDLKITSIDFLLSHNNIFYLTDINSTPNYNYIKNGAKIVGDYLINQAKK